MLVLELVLLVLVLVLLVLVPSKGQLPICYSYFRQPLPRSAQVKQPSALHSMQCDWLQKSFSLRFGTYWLLAEEGCNQYINDRGKKSRC